MDDTLKLSVQLPVSPEILFDAWMSSTGHSRFTGAQAEVENKTGGKYTAWDGYIEGTTLELKPHSKIVQSWRTAEFPGNAPDSRLEIWFEPRKGGTLLTLVHSGIPKGQEEEYEKGWIDYYFEPMKQYYGAGK